MRFPFISKVFRYVLLVGILFCCNSLHADRIREVMDIDWQGQLGRLLRFEDFTVQIALLGAMVLGVSCATLGSFLVVRQRSLFGDALSHAVLPGVAIGFLWNMNKDPMALFWGAVFAATIGAWAIYTLKKTTRLKEDTVLGLILAGFYGLGICLLTMIQNIPEGSQSGLDAFLFGQASVLSELDLILLIVVCLVNLGVIFLFYKQFLLLSFDPDFAQASGMSFRVFDILMTVLVALTIVVSLKAVGAILVSALLIIPGATALLITSRMHRVIILSGVFGLFSGVLGVGVSFVEHNLPTGPFIVLAASLGFALVFIFRPRAGIFWRMLRRRDQSIH